MVNKFKILSLLTLLISTPVWAGDPFQDPEEVDRNYEVENNPLISDFLNVDETEASRHPVKKWERIKSLEELGKPPMANYEEQQEPLPPINSSYSSDPFANRMDYLEQKFGINKPNSPY